MAAEVAAPGRELQPLRQVARKVEAALGLGAVAERRPQEDEQDPLEQGPSVVGGFQNAPRCNASIGMRSP